MFNALKTVEELTSGATPSDAGALYLNATITEATDAPNAFTGNPVISVGDRFDGRLSTVSDKDVIAIHLDAGESYVFTAFGTNGVTSGVSDPTLEVLDANGVRVAFNDDVQSGILFPAVNFTAATTGTYFIRVGGFDTGTYTVQTATSIYTVDQVVSQLTEMGWGIPIRIHHGEVPGEVISYNISNLTAAGQQLAEWAFEAWSTVTGLVFAPASIATAEMVFFDGASDSVPANFSGRITPSTGGAFAGPSSYNPNTGEINYAGVNVGTQWLSFYGTTLDSYSFQTYLHEIGHALGLGHAGPYDGTATYGVDNLFLNDSVQVSIMSYFSLTDNTFVVGNDGTVITPMIADIAAMQLLYGTTTINGGNTTWGANSNITGYMGELFGILFDGDADVNGMLAGNGNLIFTLADTDGNDTIDFSTRNVASRIDLRQGAVSDLFGQTGNMVIALGTTIENIRLGSGNDTIVANDADNRITSGLGNDSVDGGDGNDTAVINVLSSSATITVDGSVIRVVSSQGTDVFTNVEILEFTDRQILVSSLGAPPAPINGGAGAETLTGGAGNDTINGEGGNDRLEGNDGNDSISGGDGNDQILGHAGDDILLGDAGNDTISASDGNDYVDGGAGRDRIGGGFGNDTIYGGDDDDHIGGGSGRDSLFGGLGNDSMSAGFGLDTLYGGDGNDHLAGSYDADEIYGGTGADDIGGGTGNDTIEGGDGNDTIGAGDDNDLVFGGANDDFIAGGNGNDTLLGDAGNDTLNGGQGNDLMTGGLGVDRFVFNTLTSGERDVVTDWANGSEKFQVHGLSGATSQIKFSTINFLSVSGGTEFLALGHTVFVANANTGDFDVTDFVFV